MYFNEFIERPLVLMMNMQRATLRIRYTIHKIAPRVYRGTKIAVGKGKKKTFLDSGEKGLMGRGED